VLTCYHQEGRLSPLQLHHQLRRLCCPDADSPLQSPPSVARYTRSLRRWEGRCRCRHRCCRRPCPSLLRFPQVSLRCYKPNTSRSQSIPRIPGLTPLLSSAAAAAGRGVLSAALFGLICWSLSKMLTCFGAGLRRVTMLLKRGGVGT
jgi:hypothetical protein